MITCRLLTGISTLIFLSTVVTSSDDSGSDEEGSIRETDKLFANAAPELEPSIIPKTAIYDKSKSTFPTAQLFDFWTLIKKKCLISECDIKQRKSAPNSGSHSTLTDPYKYPTSQSVKNRDTNTTPSIDHNAIRNSLERTTSDIGIYSITHTADSFPGLQNNESIRRSPSVPVTKYHSKAVKGTSLNSISGSSIAQADLTTKSTTSLTVHVSSTASRSIEDSLITPISTKQSIPIPTISSITRVHVTNSTSSDSFQTASSVLSPNISLHSIKHLTSTPNPFKVDQSSNSDGLVNYTSFQVTRSLVNENENASTFSDSTITPIIINPYIINPINSVNVQGTKNTSVRETASRSTMDTVALIFKTNPTIKPSPNDKSIQTRSIKTLFSWTLLTTTTSPFTVDEMVRYRQTNTLTGSNPHTTAQVVRSTGNETAISPSRLESFFIPSTFVDSSWITSDYNTASRSTTRSTHFPFIISLLSRTHSTKKTRPITIFPITQSTTVNETAVKSGSTTSNTITKRFTYKSDQVIQHKTVDRNDTKSTTRPFITSLSKPNINIKFSPRLTFKFTFTGSNNRHILDSSDSVDKKTTKKERDECNIKACYGKEECQQELEAYKKCLSIQPANQTSGVKLHLFIFITHILCSLEHIFKIL